MGTYITKKHREELEKELEDLKLTLTGKIADKLSESTMKDQMEDSTYAEAMQERDVVVGRIEEIHMILEKSELIDEKVCNTEYVTLGAWVTVKMRGRERELHLVGASETNPNNGKISYESPLGQALVGAKKGETVFVLQPDGGEQEIEVVSIRCE